MLRDTDTAVLLDAVRQRSDPLSWFTGDWPLGNHFYRPVSTLTFELDDWLGKGAAAQFGWTNALLAVLCVLALFWLARELTDSPPTSCAAASLFGLWHLMEPGQAGLAPVIWAVAAAAFLGLLRSGPRHLGAVLVGFGSMAFLAVIVDPVVPLGQRIVWWLPGRTASTMTVFALVALACYARAERLTAPRRPAAPPRPLDLPATKGTVVARPGQFPWILFPLSFVAAALALGSYEQAVMLPALFGAVAVWVWASGGRPRWGWVAGSVVLLVSYLVLRAQVVPTAVSGYQDQQLRDGPGVVLAVLDYLLPGAPSLVPVWTGLGTGALIMLTSSFWGPVGLITANVGALVSSVQSRAAARVGVAWGMAVVAFLPMAWLKPFEHYHYWPSAFRALAMALFVPVAVGAWLNAVSPRALRAPPRPRPAPGSLPRP